MDIRILADGELAASWAALMIANRVHEAVQARGRFLVAVSGGTSPWQMLRVLAKQGLPWDKIHVFQVDERIAPAGHADRNLTHLRESLLANSPFPEANLHPMPVEAGDVEAAARSYAQTLADFGGVLDVVHLGLGPDGHTASLIPGDPVLDVLDRDVALTGVYQGRRRMTVTYPLIDRARHVLWLVTGANKVDMLPRLRDKDRTIPGGRVKQDNASVVADAAAGAKVTSTS